MNAKLVTGRRQLREDRAMTSRNFTVTVKERNPGEPCFLVFESDDNVGVGTKAVRLDLRRGTGLAEAQELARKLNANVIRLSIE